MDKLSGEFRVLIVDDSPDIHTVFKQILSYQTPIKPGRPAITISKTSRARKPTLRPRIH
jgi:hypothetical protein